MRMLFTLAAIAVLGAGAGCANGTGAPQASGEASNQAASYNPLAGYFAGTIMQNAIVGCRTKRLAGELTSFSQSAACSNEIIAFVYDEINYPYMDLISLITIGRRIASERVDSGKWTETQAQVRMAELGRQVNLEISRRQSASSPGAGASSGANARQISGPQGPAIEFSEYPIQTAQAPDCPTTNPAIQCR